MTLTTNHLLTLLQDILHEQSSELQADVSEYQQIKRLVKTMMANNSISNETLLQLLPEIYNYGRLGENAQNMEEHIHSNKDNIEQWLHAIDETTLQ